MNYSDGTVGDPVHMFHYELLFYHKIVIDWLFRELTSISSIGPANNVK